MKSSKLKKGVFFSYISRIITVLVGVLYTPIMIRLLGQSEYGLYNIAASIIAFLGVLNFGFGSAYMRFYSRYKVRNNREKISSLNGMFLSIFSFLGVLALVSGIVLTMNINLLFGPSLSVQELETAKRLMFVLVINLGLSFPVTVFNTYIQANEEFVFANILQIFRQISTPMVSLPLLLLEYGSMGLVVGTFTVNLVSEAIAIYFSIKKLNIKFSFKNFDIVLLKEISIYSFFIFINMVVDQVNQNVDKTILGRYSGTMMTAIYSIGERIEIIFQQLSSTISNVFIPRIHRMISDDISDKELTYFFTTIGRMQFVLLSLFLSGFIYLGRPFIGMWAGENYYNAYPIALILMLTVTVPLIQNVGIEIQRAKNKHQFRSWVYLIMAIGNILISIPLVKIFDGFGAAIGTSLTYLIGNGLVMNIYNHFKVGLNMKYFWKEILKFAPAFIIPTIYGILMARTIDLYSIRNFLICGMIYTLLFSISMWFFGLNETEKNIVRSMVGKKKRSDI